MKTNGILATALAALLALAPAAVQAEVLTLTPSRAQVFPADESGVTRVALQFDLSALPTGQGWRVDEAVLDWTVAGIPSDRHSEYALYPVTQAWTENSVAAGTLPTLAEHTADVWSYEPLDYQRNHGGLLRFDLLGLVRDWLGAKTANYGVVIATEDMTRTALRSQLKTARLTIRYGFLN